MFSVVNFLKRHRRKFVISGLVLGGGIILTKLAAWKLREWEEKEITDCYELLKKDRHFESTRKTCNETISSLSPNLKRSILFILDSDALTSALKLKPPNKLDIWEELKVVSFCRPVALIYGCSLLVVFLNIQMNILGGYLYVENTRQKQSTDVLLSQAMQQQILALLQRFFDHGLQNLVNALMPSVRYVVDSLSLKDMFNLSKVENVFRSIKEKIEDADSNPCKNLTTFLQAALSSPGVHQSHDNTQCLQKILSETTDMLASRDCEHVFKSVVKSGFALLTDSLAGCFMEGANSSAQFVNPQQLELPLAKLIPYLCNLIHVQCSFQDGELLPSLLQLEEIKIFAANIYEAFSHQVIDDSKMQIHDDC